MTAPLTVSCAFPPGPDTVAHAQLAESLGYERVWLYDSPVLYGDVWVHLARVAEATEPHRTRPRGAGARTCATRSTQASAIATVAGLAPGRLVVAIGTGFTARMAMGQKPLTWAATRTYIAQVKGLLAGESMVVEGKVVKLTPPAGWLDVHPVPILVAANGPKGLAVAQRARRRRDDDLRRPARVRLVGAARVRHGARPGRGSRTRSGRCSRRGRR